LKPGANGAEILDEDQLGTEAQPEAIIASVAVANGRFYVISDSNIYCIGKKAISPTPASPSVEGSPDPNRPATHVQVVPTELILMPGDKVKFGVRLYDEQGRFIRTEPSATWSLDQLKGTIENGQFTVTSDSISQAGLVKAKVGEITGSASVRVFPPLPWSEGFDSFAINTIPPTWVNSTPKFTVRELEGGNKVLVKTTEGSSLASRARAYFGPSDFSDYTVEGDVFATVKRRQQGDAGVIAQRYVLALYGNGQMLHLEPWQPETARTVAVPFAWKPDTWYRLKLEVRNLGTGTTRARGKVWLASESEPEAWMVQRFDPYPNRKGAPGIFGNALAEIYFDNLKVYPTKPDVPVSGER
jgi:hypothetical protein